MNRTSLAPILALSLAACRPGQPCPACEEDDDQPADLGGDDEDTPDLPCGGADLQTDNGNCGECGNDCSIKGSGVYEAGGCVGGVCAPTWYAQEWPEPSPITCDEVCGTLTCQPNACAELTAFVCEVVDSICGGLTGGPSPLVDFAGACDEPIPWPDLVFGGTRAVVCCCG